MKMGPVGWGCQKGINQELLVGDLNDVDDEIEEAEEAKGLPDVCMPCAAEVELLPWANTLELY